MRTEQRTWNPDAGWTPRDPPELGDAQLVLAFGSSELMDAGKPVGDLQTSYPEAEVIGCSTAGEIAGTRVTDDTLVATAVRFDTTRVKTAYVDVAESAGSRDAGEQLAGKLDHDGLVHAFVLSDGQDVNGSELVAGLTSALPDDVEVTGGLAGDGARFERTPVLAGGEARPGRIVLLGLYGPDLRIGHGSLGGWDPFGPKRRITRAEGNVLYELDDKPALELYKEYLGDQAADLPASGLLFPLSVEGHADGQDLVRTILGIDEQEQSLTFAGDLPQGAFAQLMRANFDRLVDGAHSAAQASVESLAAGGVDLAILISCVGRKLVLKQRTEEELEAVRDVIGPQATMCGFYSYGEICPSAPHADCNLHNQTMTITTLSER